MSCGLPEQRAEIADAFGAPLVDVFATSEGLVGVSEPGEAAITFASDGCIVEPVDERDRPVPVGEPSARILVTVLDRWTQPLIRYAIEDRCVRVPDDPHHGHLRATVEGRADEILRYGSIEVHPIVIRSVLVKTSEVEDYQVRQTATASTSRSTPGSASTSATSDHDCEPPSPPRASRIRGSSFVSRLRSSASADPARSAGSFLSPAPPDGDRPVVDGPSPSGVGEGPCRELPDIRSSTRSRRTTGAATPPTWIS